MDQVAGLVGTEMAGRLRDTSFAVFQHAHDYALSRGIIIADTKFEFGTIDGELALIDEVLTPDSSRFWDAEGYEPGHSQPNFDKQYVRDHLLSTGWDREPPAPALPEEIVVKTRERYLDAYGRLTGEALD
jgi:phosphoribosylaminoimidazole-succinocarboxamide synthase